MLFLIFFLKGFLPFLFFVEQGQGMVHCIISSLLHTTDIANAKRRVYYCVYIYIYKVDQLEHTGHCRTVAEKMITYY